MANKRFQWFVALVLTLSLITFLAACGNSSNNDSSPSASSGSSAPSTDASSTPSPAKDPVDMTMIIPNAWATQGVKDAIAKYEQDTGNKIKLDVYPDDQYLNIEKTKITTNDAPDLIMVNMGQVYMPYSFLEPLDGPVVDRMDESLKKTASKDGKVYEAPLDPVGFYGVIYNKKVFEKAGIKPPFKTYQELIAASEALLKIGVTPIGMAGKSGWPILQLPIVAGTYAFANNQAAATDIATNKVKPQDSVLKDVAERFVGLKKYMNEDYLSTGNPDIMQRLLDGTVAMDFYPDFGYGEMKDMDETKLADLGFMPATLGDDYISSTLFTDSGHAIAVPHNAKHKQEAKDFINYITQEANFKTFVSPSLGKSPYKDFEMDMNPFQKEMSDLIAAHNIPTGPNMVSFWDPSFQLGGIGAAFGNILAGQKIETAFDEWYKEYAKLNQTAKTPGF